MKFAKLIVITVWPFIENLCWALGRRTKPIYILPLSKPRPPLESSQGQMPHGTYLSVVGRETVGSNTCKGDFPKDSIRSWEHKRTTSVHMWPNTAQEKDRGRKHGGFSLLRITGALQSSSVQQARVPLCRTATCWHYIFVKWGSLWPQTCLREDEPGE